MTNNTTRRPRRAGDTVAIVGFNKCLHEAELARGATREIAWKRYAQRLASNIHDAEVLAHYNFTCA